MDRSAFITSLAAEALNSCILVCRVPGIIPVTTEKWVKGRGGGALKAGGWTGP